MRHALESACWDRRLAGRPRWDRRLAGRRNSQKLAAPDRTIESQASAVPGHAQQRARKTMLGHAGADMGIMVLDADDWQAHLLGVPCGVVIRMLIADHGLRLQSVEARQICGDAAECLEGKRCIQIADVLTDNDLAARGDGQRVFLMSAYR